MARLLRQNNQLTDTTSNPASSDTLQSFTLDDLAQYTREGAFGPTASPDFRVFYVGRDDVHGVLVHLFTRVRLSVKMNMFGYDDDQLNQILVGLVKDPTVMVQVTLDRSQANGAHEKAILSSDEANDPAGYAADFAVPQLHLVQLVCRSLMTELLRGPISPGLWRRLHRLPWSRAPQRWCGGIPSWT